MSEQKIYRNAMDLPVMKPFADVKDSESNIYIVYFDVEKRILKNGQRAELFTAKATLKNGSPVFIKSARIAGGAFSYRHTRVQGEITTTPGEIAAQLNRLFAEE